MLILINLSGQIRKQMCEVKIQEQSYAKYLRNEESEQKSLNQYSVHHFPVCSLVSIKAEEFEGLI